MKKNKADLKAEATSKLLDKSNAVFPVIIFIAALLQLIFYIDIVLSADSFTKYLIVTISLFALYCVLNFAIILVLFNIKNDKIKIKPLMSGLATILFLLDSYKVMVYANTLESVLLWSIFLAFRDVLFLLLLYKINRTVLTILNNYSRV